MPSTSPPVATVSLTQQHKISGGKVLSRTRRSGKPSRGAAAARRGSRRAHRHRIGSVLSAPVSACWQGQGGHCHGPQDRRLVLQYLASWYGIQRSGRLPITRSVTRTSSPISREGRSRSDMSCRPHPRPAECFLGIPRIPVSSLAGSRFHLSRERRRGGDCGVKRGPALGQRCAQ